MLTCISRYQSLCRRLSYGRLFGYNMCRMNVTVVADHSFWSSLSGSWNCCQVLVKLCRQTSEDEGAVKEDKSGKRGRCFPALALNCH